VIVRFVEIGGIDSIIF